jgi:cell division topological specificity factor
MASFFDWVFGRSGGRGSGSKAKERLQFILVHDRIHLPPERLEEMKQEILAVIAKYITVDSDHVEIAMQRRERDSLLVAEIPFYKTAEGIEKDDPELDEAQEAARRAARALLERQEDGLGDDRIDGDPGAETVPHRPADGEK